jgi:hypothetical protein
VRSSKCTLKKFQSLDYFTIYAAKCLEYHGHDVSLIITEEF